MFEDICKTCPYKKAVAGTDEYVCADSKEYKDGKIYIHPCCEETCNNK